MILLSALIHSFFFFILEWKGLDGNFWSSPHMFLIQFNHTLSFWAAHNTSFDSALTKKGNGQGQSTQNIYYDLIWHLSKKHKWTKRNGLHAVVKRERPVKWSCVLQREANEGIIEEYSSLSSVSTPLSLADMNRVEHCSENMILKYTFSPWLDLKLMRKLKRN